MTIDEPFHRERTPSEEREQVFEYSLVHVCTTKRANWLTFAGYSG
jgi:hypothetical protein